MVDYIINENGVERKATEEEKKEIIERQNAWNNDLNNRKLKEIRYQRNKKLSETDYLATSDNVMSDEIKAFRKSMRDIPQNYSADKYDELLAQDVDGNLTHTVWKKP
tara:strand:+ start:602 stop:922 length:321 start_codon:yes stop_codon:yes gene_type:complete